MTARRLAAAIIAACIGMTTGFPIANAQTDATLVTAQEPATRTLCWRPRPAPVCRAYIPTEFSYEHPIALTRMNFDSYQEDDFHRRFVAAAGLMRNRGSQAAYGGLLGLSTDDPGGFGLLRLEGRYRRWIGNQAGIDLGLGLAQKEVYSELGDQNVRARGFTAGIGFDYAFAGVDARVDWLSGGGQPRRAAFVGVHASSYGAPVALGALTTVRVIAVIASLSGA